MLILEPNGRAFLDDLCKRYEDQAESMGLDPSANPLLCALADLQQGADPNALSSELAKAMRAARSAGQTGVYPSR